MSAEKIIERIEKDTQIKIKEILNEAKMNADNISKEMKSQAQKEAERLTRNGERQIENENKILISKATQELRRDVMKAKEDLIEACFSQALQKLSSLPDEQYKKTIINFIKVGKKRLGHNCTMLISRPLDKEIAKTEGIPVQGTIQSSGGIILQSADGKITINNTFEHILSRKKDELRIQIGNILFTAP